MNVDIGFNMAGILPSVFAEDQPKHPPHRSLYLPVNSMLKPDFKYTHSTETNIRKTFKEVRKRIELFKQRQLKDYIKE